MKLLLATLLVCSVTFAKENAKDKEILLAGKKIYQETCISCHGVAGKTNPDMKLIVRPRELRKSILTEAQMFQVIKNGAHKWGAHADIMPTFKYVYDDKQIKSVAHYVSKTFNSHRNERVRKLLDDSMKLSYDEQKKMLKTGKNIFQRKCGMCHGSTGNGESEYVEQSKSNENFIYPYNLQKILLTEEQIFLYAKFGGHFWGTAKNDMPSWKKRYNDVKLKSVAKYVHEKIKKSTQTK